MKEEKKNQSEPEPLNLDEVLHDLRDSPATIMAVYDRRLLSFDEARQLLGLPRVDKLSTWRLDE